MTTLTIATPLQSVERALATLKEHRHVSFEMIDAIMHFHVLEVPDLTSLRHDFEQRNWYALSGQLRSFSKMRQVVLRNSAMGDAGREALRQQAFLIELLDELSQVTASFGREEPEIGN